MEQIGFLLPTVNPLDKYKEPDGTGTVCVRDFKVKVYFFLSLK